MDSPLYYEEHGEGFPLIMLHGNGESHEYFSSQIECFSKDYRVIAPDTRGHGKSPRGQGKYTIERLADDLFSFMCSLSVNRAHILGFSDGGNIALTFALKHPEAVESLILNGANLDPSGVKRRVQIPIELGYRLARLFSGRSPRAESNADILSLMVGQPNIDPKRLAKLKMPALVIAGTHDMIKESHTRLIAGSISGSRLVFIEGDHFIANKRPREFNLAVSEFLSSNNKEL